MHTLRIFCACCKNPESSLYKAVQISCPNTAAARKGLKRRVISREVYEQIVEAIIARKQPPMYTVLGGDICIHGMRISEGCIGIDCENMDYVFPLIGISKTPICIVGGTKEEYLISEDMMHKVRKPRLFRKDIETKSKLSRSQAGREQQ